MNILKEFCNNKNAILVGNSEKILEKDNGKLIDSYDVVIRMNYGHPTDREKQLGTRTDIWSSSNTEKRHLESYEFFKNVPYILFPNIRIYDKYKPIGKNIFYNDEGNYRNFIGDFKSPRPSTGAITIDYLLNTVGTLKSLTIIGFDFFNSPTFYNRKNFRVIHKTDVEQKYIEKQDLIII